MTFSYDPSGLASGYRTPPELKWLLNERAALQGLLAAEQKKQQLLQLRAAAMKARIERLRQEAQELQPTVDSLKERIHALDRVMGLGYPQVPPNAGGQVQPWSGRWGERGALSRYLRDALRAIAPNAVPVRTLIEWACAHFSVSLESPAEREALRLNVRARLRQIRDQTGRIQSLNVDGQALWRWTCPPTFLDLAELSSPSPEEAFDDHAESDPFGGEVGTERTGGRER